jgi:hypothetical protein
VCACCTTAFTVIVCLLFLKFHFNKRYGTQLGPSFSTIVTDRIQSRVLRLCVGAFRLTPVEALQVDSGKLPLRKRPDKLAWARLKESSEGHPAVTATGECWEQGVGKQRAYGWTIG